MGLEELLSTLRKNEQRQINDIWQAAKDEAAAIRQQVADAIADITQKHTEQLDSACLKSKRAIFSETDINVRGKKLFAHQALEHALYNAAMKQLPFLRQHNYEGIFALLVEELPQRQWEEIIVSPQDLDLAARFFAAETIRPEPAIIAGLIATAAEGKIIVDNTFEKRLARKWPQILPAIIAEIEKRYAKPESA